MIKEIIIDGVDVSECEFLWKEKLPKKVCNNGNLDCDCNSNPNCYYKQLKRKTNECEKKSWEISNLGYKIKNQRREINERLKQIEKLKRKEQECEKLKSENFTFEELIKTQEKLIEEIKKYLGISNKTIIQRLEELQERRDKLSEENEELKNATVTVAEGLNFQQERADKLEQECEELKQWKEDAENLFKTQTDNANKIINRYKQALDEIENFLKAIMETNKVYPLQANLQKVLNIINKAKRGE